MCVSTPHQLEHSAIASTLSKAVSGNSYLREPVHVMLPITALIVMLRKDEVIIKRSYGKEMTQINPLR